MKYNLQKILQIFNLLFVPILFSTLIVYFPDSFSSWIGIISLILLATIWTLSSTRGKFQKTATNYILSCALLISSISLIFFTNYYFPIVVFFNFVMINLIIAASSTNSLNEYRILHFFKLLLNHFLVYFLSGAIYYFSQYWNRGMSYFKPSRAEYGTTEPTSNSNQYHYLIAILLFIVFAIPILLFVISQLSAANTQFADLISGLTNFISSINIFLHLFTFIFLAIVMGGIYKFADVMTSADLSEIDNSKMSINFGVFLFLEAVVVMLNIVYALFTFIEASCDVKGLRECIFGVKNYESYSRATYDGVISIAFVIILNLIIQYFTLERRITVKKMFNDINNYFLVGLTLLLSVACFERLYLYISTYGLTDVRFQAIFFYIFVVVACALSIYSIIKRSNPIVNVIITSGLLCIALMVSLPFNYLVFEMNWYMAKNNMIQNYDVFYPYSKGEIDSNSTLKNEWVSRYNSGDLEKLKNSHKISEGDYNSLLLEIGK